MPSIDFTTTKGSNVSGTGNPWRNTNNIGSSDGNTTDILAGSSLNSLYVYGLNTGLPENIKIDGIEVLIVARTSSGTGTPVLDVSFTRDTTPTIISNIKTTTTLTTSLVTYTLGSPTDLWGSGLKRVTLANEWFGLIITPRGSANRTFEIDQVIFRLHYTSTGFLTGSRSKFSGSVSSQYDDPLPASNGVSPQNQVLAENVNFIGDCIYSIEETILQAPQASNPVGVIGSSAKMFATTITVTGVLTAPVTGLLQYHRFFGANQPGAPIASGGNLTSAMRTNLVTPELRKQINWNVLSAVGWVVSGSSNVPLFVQPNLHYTIQTGTVLDSRTGFHLSILASARNPIGTYTGSLTNGSPGYNFDTRVTSFTVIPSGNVTLKIFALGRYS